MTRGERLRAEGKPLGFPDLAGAGYVLDALMEAGPTVWTAFGEQPLGWVEVKAYADATEAVSEPWELRALIDMSRAYMVARSKGEDPLARAPADQEAE